LQKPAATAQKQENVAALCSKCGLCCNGVLFGDVELTRRDNEAELRAFGLQMGKKGANVAFLQPCSCLHGTLCKIYPNRPVNCRTFECRLLQQAHAGEVSRPAALRTIRKTRALVKRALIILRKLEEHSEHLPLNRRFAAVLTKPIDLSDEPAVLKRRARLMKTIDELSGLLAEKFLN
jgi:Fe-S-cluster containining protein